MRRASRALLNAGLMISATAGVLHFFAPYAFAWHSYIPGAPAEIHVSIDYVNFFFSLLLAGLSLVLWVYRREVLSGDPQVYAFYALLVLAWLARVVITVVIPWPTTLQTWLLVGFSTELVLVLLPAVYVASHRARRVTA